jgi:hypothetical protein
MVRYLRRLRSRRSRRRRRRELHARRGAISRGKLRAGLPDGFVGALPDLSIAAALVSCRNRPLSQLHGFRRTGRNRQRILAAGDACVEFLQLQVFTRPRQHGAHVAGVVAVAFALPPQGEHFAPQGGGRLMDRVHRDRLIDQFRCCGELRILNLFAGHQLARLPEPSLNLLLVEGALRPLLQVACIPVLRIQPQGLSACFERVFVLKRLECLTGGVDMFRDLMVAPGSDPVESAVLVH